MENQGVLQSRALIRADSGYNVTQSVIAIGSGGAFREGVWVRALSARLNFPARNTHTRLHILRDPLEEFGVFSGRLQLWQSFLS